MEEMKQAPAEEAAPAESGSQLKQMVEGVVGSMSTLLAVLDEGGNQVNPQAKQQIEQAAELFKAGVAALGASAPAQMPKDNPVPVQQEGRPMSPAGV